MYIGHLRGFGAIFTFSLAPSVHVYFQKFIFFFMDAKNSLTIGRYIVRRLEEQGVKVRSLQNVHAVYFDLGAAVYIRCPGIVSCQVPGMSFRRKLQLIELSHAV